MKPSFFSSTLSLAFILSLLSLFFIVISAILVAVFAPEAYKLISDEKAAFMVVGMLYFTLIGQITGAYLGARTPNTKQD